MIYRVLPRGEWHKVAPVFAEHDSHLPTNGFIVVGGEHEDEIDMLQCCHQVTHAGPVWIKPTFRGRGLWKGLQEYTCHELKRHDIRSFYQFGTSANESQLKRLGLKPLGWSVWLGEVT